MKNTQEFIIETVGPPPFDPDKVPEEVADNFARVILNGYLKFISTPEGAEIIRQQVEQNRRKKNG